VGDEELRPRTPDLTPHSSFLLGNLGHEGLAVADADELGRLIAGAEGAIGAG
jgi:hypothetical protein